MVQMLATKQEFDDALSNNKTIVVDFTATWCPPCRMIGPKFEAMAGEFSNVAFFKVDVDQNSETAESCGISAMPTFKVFVDGKQVAEIMGADEAKLRSTIARYN